MGFLIFALRKLQLQRQKSQLEYRLTVLGQKLENIMQQESQLQENISTGKNMINTLSSQSLFSYNQKMYGQMASGAGSDADQAKFMEQYMAQQQAASMANNLSNSIFEGISQSRMTVLKQQEDMITQEKTSKESLNTYITSELEHIDKSEDQAAKDAAPKFGQG